jgi:hypothetical protein
MHHVQSAQPSELLQQLSSIKAVNSLAPAGYGFVGVFYYVTHKLDSPEVWSRSILQSIKDCS